MILSSFYADDGRIAVHVQAHVQHGFEVLLKLFAQIGLFQNVRKTKAMVSAGLCRPDSMSDVAYK